MKPKKWSYGQVGSVSSATRRPEDLIPAFTSELRDLGHRSKELTKIEKRIARLSEDDAYWQDEIAQWDLDSLFDMLQEHAKPYMYFGSYPGDGADYGFWVSEGMEYDFDGLKVDDLSEIPNDYTGEVLEVNDHGNMTLYFKNRLPLGHKNSLKEIWSVV